MGKRQRGISLLGFLFLIIVVAVVAYIACKLVPAYIEAAGVGKALQTATSSSGDDDTLGAVRGRFIRALSSQYVDDNTVHDSDLVVRPTNQGSFQLVVAYDKRIHLFYNIDALLHFEKTAPARGTITSEAQ